MTEDQAMEIQFRLNAFWGWSRQKECALELANLAIAREHGELTHKLRQRYDEDVFKDENSHKEIADALAPVFARIAQRAIEQMEAIEVPA